MPRRICPQCERRLPYAGRRCGHCGWAAGEPVDAEVARGTSRRKKAVWFLVALLIGAGAGIATLRSQDMADWYAGFAAQHLPSDLSSFAPVDTERGAFFFCARQVAREMEGKFSVETFPSIAESEMEVLGEGRYRIRAWVDEARADGQRVRHEFDCTVKYGAGRWEMEKLELT